MRHRVAAVIIKDKKLLLVRDSKADFFSLPWGSIETWEDHTTALKRELQEEIWCNIIKDSSFLWSFEHINQVYNVPQIEHIYYVHLDGHVYPNTEIIELIRVEQNQLPSIKTPMIFTEIVKKIEFL
jgi:ADP-ribose pyrophosphatase YjhB (NUDIX family)